MRAVFSLLGLVVVLAIVGLLVKAQFRPTPAPARAAAQAANPDLPVVPVVTPGNAKQIEDKVRADVERTMQQGAAREMPE